MPPPGECRAWYPGRPPRHQPPSGNCDSLLRTAQANAWVLYRPNRERRVVPDPDDELEVIRAALDEDYEIVEELGRGGMAIVYRARERAST